MCEFVDFYYYDSVFILDEISFYRRFTFTAKCCRKNIKFLRNGEIEPDSDEDYDEEEDDEVSGSDEGEEDDGLVSDEGRSINILRCCTDYFVRPVR